MSREELRQQIAKAYSTGDVSIRTLGERYKLSPSSVYRFIMAEEKAERKRELANPKPIVKTPVEETASMPTDVGWLQEELRMSRIRVLLLEATIDISDEQFDTDMRKKTGPRQS
jgi:transposase-like protein